MKIKNLPEKYNSIWEKAFPLLRQGRPGDDKHAIEVVEFILDYSKGKDLELDILIPVAIMHDIGHSAILPEHIIYVSGERKLINAKLVHMLAGAKIAKDILESVGYNKEKIKEIVDIVSVHDMDQIKEVDIKDIYNTENKKIFHDIDALDRYTKERLGSMKKLYPGKSFEELVKLVEDHLYLFFFDEFRNIATERIKELRGEDVCKTFKLLFDRDRLNLYPWEFANQCLTKDIEKVFGKKIKKIISEFKKSHIYVYVDVEDFNEFGEFLFNRLRKDRKFYKLVEKNIFQSGDKLLDFCNKLPKRLENLSTEQLFKIYEKYREKIIKMRVWGWLPPLVDGVYIYFLSDFAQEKLREFLKEKNIEDKTAEYYSILSSSEKISEVQSEEIERLKLIKELDEELVMNLKNMNTDELLKKLDSRHISLIRNHVKKFEWLTYAYIGPPMNEKDVFELIKNSLNQKESIDKQLDSIYKHYKDLRKDKEKIFDEINPPENLKYLLKISALFMYLKDLRKGVYQKSYVLMDPVIEEISKRLNLSIEETKYLTNEEVREALIDGKDFTTIAKSRTNYCVVITQDGETEVFIKEKAKEIIKKQIEESKIEKEIDELKGSIAFSGKVQGIVKIILVPEDMPKINEGDILVSSATNPDLIIAMKKASAFVTDMGGITSHAAIVSREMKKPCIVGTKIATKVLKDGDKVEVDAEKGIIKILKQKN